MRRNTITSERIAAIAAVVRHGGKRYEQAHAAGICPRTLTNWLAKGQALDGCTPRPAAPRRYAQLWQAVDNASRAYNDERRAAYWAAWQDEQRRRDERHAIAVQNKRIRKQRYWQRFKQRVAAHRTAYQQRGCGCNWCTATW